MPATGCECARVRGASATRPGRTEQSTVAPCRHGLCCGAGVAGGSCPGCSGPALRRGAPSVGPPEDHRSTGLAPSSQGMARAPDAGRIRTHSGRGSGGTCVRTRGVAIGGQVPPPTPAPTHSLPPPTPPLLCFRQAAWPSRGVGHPWRGAPSAHHALHLLHQRLPHSVGQGRAGRPAHALQPTQLHAGLHTGSEGGRGRGGRGSEGVGAGSKAG